MTFGLRAAMLDLKRGRFLFAASRRDLAWKVSSKGAMDGQGEPQRLPSPGGRLRKGAAAGLVALALAQAAQAAPAERQTPSGMPVPRYVSLKFDKVNARAGPGDDHRLLWVYRAHGLPLQVIAETLEWRRVCDPEGATAWVHKRVIDGRRTTMNTRTSVVALLRRPKPDAKVAAYLNPKALAALDRCSKGWCKVSAGHAAGWVRDGELWGTSEALQCR
jgi:SH3-like domain-containing protein